MAYPAKSIANAFLVQAKNQQAELSNMKLQKLLYFAHSIYLAQTGQPLIGEPPQAWRYGPVYPSVYHHFKDCGSGPIRTWATQFEMRDGAPTFTTVGTPADQSVQQFLSSIWNTYGHQSAIALSALSHVPGGPWDVVRRTTVGERDAEIPDDLIRNYFAGALAESARTTAAG